MTKTAQTDAPGGQRETGCDQARGFPRSEDGAFIIFGLMLFVMMCLVGGLAIDVMRYETNRVHVQNTLDRAILAAAALDQPLDAEDVVLDYFAKSGLGHLISEDDIKVQESRSARRVDVAVRGQMPTTFMRLMEINALPLSTGGAAEEAISLTEISMVLDVSGSMGYSSTSGNTKLYELKRAAKRFVNVMLCNPDDADEIEDCTVEEGDVSISVVPYAEQVLLPASLLDQFNHTNEHSESTCITFYADDFSQVGVETYTDETFATYGRPLPRHITDPIQLTGYFDPSSGRNYSANPASKSPCYNEYDNRNNDRWREIYPFGHNAGLLRGEIDSLKASGNTSIDLGMKWGAALLDPLAQPAVSQLIQDNEIDDAFEGRPLNYTQRGVEKVIVLMTDGENTSQDFLYEGYHSGPSGVWEAHGSLELSIYNPSSGLYWWVGGGEWLDHPYGTGQTEECAQVRVSDGYWWWQYHYEWQCTEVAEGTGAAQLDFTTLWTKKPTAWYNQWSFLNQASSSFNTSAKNAYLDDICSAAKAAGIVVFTIGFEVSSSQHSIMRNCATLPAYYFNVNGLDIADAFAAIAREISKLRLVY